MSKSPLEFLLHEGALQIYSRTSGPGQPSSLETLIFKTKMSFASLSQKQKQIPGNASCEYSLEHSPCGEKKRSFCLEFADKKESSVCLFYPETNLTLNSRSQKKSSGIWRKQTDPRLQSREECLGNQNITGLYKFLVKFQPAALS